MKISDLAKRMILTILIIALICVVVSAIYYRSLEFIPFLLGTLLGTAVSIIKVFLLERTVNKALEMEKKKAGAYVSVHHLLRLLLSGAALLAGALVPQVSLWGVVAGVFAYQIAVYGVRFQSTKSKTGGTDAVIDGDVDAEVSAETDADMETKIEAKIDAMIEARLKAKMGSASESGILSDEDESNGGD